MQTSRGLAEIILRNLPYLPWNASYDFEADPEKRLLSIGVRKSNKIRFEFYQT